MVVRLVADGGEEDDRQESGALAPLDQLGGLEPVQVRHLHVEHDDGELVIEQRPEGFRT